jgi:predicted glycogen debranching enzyme
VTRGAFTLSVPDIRDLDTVLAREWLVTNGLGGFASGSVAGANTRRYHGLLFAALRPPVERTLMVAKLDIAATLGGTTYSLATNEFADGTIAPRGFEHLERFELEGTVPVWRFRIGAAVLEQRLWMHHGANTTYVQLTLIGGSETVALEVVPLCTYRDYHWQLRGTRTPAVHDVPSGVEIDAGGNAQRYRILSDKGACRLAPDVYWNFKHRRESERGLDDQEDLFRPAIFTVVLAPGETVSFTLTAEAAEVMPAAASLQRERSRQRALLSRCQPSERDPLWVRQLTLAADQFIVDRHSAGTAAGKTIIAGYPWFSDWGRDTMIALPGLTLSTGRFDVAASILRTFAHFVSEGMLPNRFPDAGETPEYNTVDATLWYFIAIDEYLRRTHDDTLLRELYPILKSIIDWHRVGTRFGIRVDPRDGLLRSGVDGTQLTWMDAKIGDWVVTPRTGKAVEINALWFNALRIMSDLALAIRDNESAREYAVNAAQVRRSFNERFWHAEGGYLFDVIDGPSGNDASLRPNQLFALSLRHALIDGSRARSVVDICEHELWTPVGMRSLARQAPNYVGRYAGAPHERDAVYHQGTGWSWLLGAFARAHYRVHADGPTALEFLTGIGCHLHEACVGQISEISDGDAPFEPRGCIAQAWGVAEVLFSWSEINACESSRQSGDRRALG